MKQKKPTEGDGGVKEASVKFSKTKTFEAQVRDVIKNTFDKENTHIFVANTPAVLQELGIKDRPMLITASHIYSIIVSEEQAKADGRYRKKTNYHNLGIDIVSQLPQAIANPVAIVKSNNDSSDSDIVLITTLADKVGKPVIVAVKIDGFGNYNGLEINTNLIKSAYGKDNFSRYVNDAVTENRFLYFNKKRSQELMNPPGVQFPDNLHTLDFTDNISQYKRIVNRQYMQSDSKNTKKSFKKTDSEYLELAKAPVERTKKITDASVTMAGESPQRSAETSVTDNVTQSAVDVKTNYSRQRLGDAWEDIRTKMYENQVHEDIINEVEEHIGKLRRANITREEELTGGFIPKYEALLKLAREHTKGSEVSATRLADTLNDLVWVAHDGNLDTKQFISTVRVIAG